MARRHRTMTKVLRRDRLSVPRAPNRSARYYARLPADPTRPYTIAKAAAYLASIMAVIESPPEDGPWTKTELVNLYRLARRWRHRAEGRDARWLLVGSHAGRLAAPVERALQPPPDPAWEKWPFTEDEE